MCLRCYDVTTACYACFDSNQTVSSSSTLSFHISLVKKMHGLMAQAYWIYKRRFKIGSMVKTAKRDSRERKDAHGALEGLTGMSRNQALCFFPLFFFPKALSLFRSTP